MLQPGIKQYLESIGLGGDDILLFLIACKLDLNCVIDDDTFINLISKKIIERDYINGNIIVRIPIFENEEPIDDTSNLVQITNTVEERLDEYRQKFVGVRAKSIGTKLLVKANLIRFMLSNPEYSFDDILEATDKYLEMTEPQFISNADNFIYNIEGNSTLSIMLETIAMTQKSNNKIV